jgi:tyrosine-protein kinase Etk/Wzc
MVVSAVPVLAYDFFDKSVRSQRQLETVTGRNVLESVPVFHQLKVDPLKGKYGLRPLINVPCNPIFTREIFDALQIKINLHLLKSANKILLVSSLEDGAGKSTISSNLAVSYALRGNRTLLVDGDLRRGTVAATFGLPDSGGFASLLSNPGPLSDDDCRRYLVKTVIPNLFLLPASMESTNPGSLLSSPRMLEFKQFCMKHMDYVIIDTPPLGAVSDAAVIQNVFTNYLFVVRYGKTRVADLVNRINEFNELPEKVIGYILNQASLNSVGSYRRYSSYYVR